MGIARAQFNDILGSIFTAGNTIQLFSTVPSEATESGGVTISSIPAYRIQEGDFSCAGGVVTSAKNIMLCLYENSSPVTCRGFGVFGTSGMLYFGSFTSPIEIGYNDVPAIKRYNDSKGEGIRITITSTEASATTA